MERLSEELVRRLAYEKRLAIYRMAHDKQIPADQVESYMYEVEMLTQLNLEGKDFVYNTVSILGMENCCRFFKALCEQYRVYKNPDNEFSEYDASSFRCDIDVKDGKKMDIGLHDASHVVDRMITSNYKELREGSMQGNPDDVIYTYAFYNTFANAYYHLRDLIEGKPYYDGVFMTEYRRLEGYEEDSANILAQVAMQRGIPVATAKKYLLGLLNSGIESLVQTPVYSPEVVAKK